MAYARILIRLIPLVAILGAACSDEKPGGTGAADVITDGDATDIEEDVFNVDPLPQRECTSNSDCFRLYPEIEACETLLCDSGKGICVFGNIPDLSLCEDKNHCTTETICLSGLCAGGKTVNCDDGNPCTSDTCSPDSGCTSAPAPAFCEDGDPCTSGDLCEDGECLPGLNICPCVSDAECVQFDDGDGCNGTLECNENNLCVVDVDSVVACSGISGEGCLISKCDPAIGECVTSLMPDGIPCKDGNVCTLTELCHNGTCSSDILLDCEGGTCATGTCDPKLGCQFEPLDGNCDDGNPCTVEDVCASGVCMGTGNECPCESAADCEVSDDGNLCNGTLDCLYGFCGLVPFSVITCDPSGNTPCHVATCVPETGECVQAPVNVDEGCDDGNACTTDTACEEGACLGGAPVDCDDDNPCTDESCDPLTGCIHDPNEQGCDDGDPCTVADQCKNGTCAGFAIAGECVVDCTTDEECEDNNACTIDSCSPEFSICIHVPDLTCMDCTSDAECDDGNPCTLLTCGESNQCVGGPVNAPCSDGTVCTVGDACIEGSCVPGTLLECDDSDACTIDDCSAISGCVFSVIPGCTECGSGPLDNDCDDGNPCTLDGCSSGVCTHLVSFNACEDGDLCTTGDLCITGTCTPGDPLDCEDGNECTSDSCDSEVGCVNAPLEGSACNPGNPCATGGVCLGSQCTAIGGDPDCCILDADCDDGFSCSEDLCVEGECSHAPLTCSSDNICAVAYCSNGLCAQTPPSTPTVGHPIYNEYFDDGLAQGWTFESTNPDVNWALSTAQSLSGDWSLHLGNPTTQNYDFGTTEALAKSPPFVLPDTAITLRFRRWMAVEEDHCFGDVLYVVVEKLDGTISVISPFMCESTTGQFVLEQYDLSAYKGLSVRFWFGFATYDDQENKGEGIYIDNVDLVAFSDAGCCGIDADCNDGNPCTNDACDPFAGCTHVTCGPEVPCNDAACSNGCDVSTNPTCCEADSDCDDSYACTTDTCVSNACQHSPINCPTTGDPQCSIDFCFQGNCALSGPGAITNGQVLFFEDFDDGAANGWSFTTNNEDVTWTPSTQQTSSAPLALYAGNPATQSYNFGNSETIAKTPYISLPQGSISLQFDQWADVEEEDCFADLLYIVVVSSSPGVPTQVLEPHQCASTNGQFITREYSLDAFAGAQVQIWFGFATFDVLQNNGEGMYIDEVQVIASPPGPCN